MQGGADDPVRGLEELVQALGECGGAVAGGRAGDPVWADVREVGDHADCREFPASQGACGTSARHTSGPLSEKTTEGDPQSRRPLSFEPEMNRAIGEICKTQKQSQPSVRLIYAKIMNEALAKFAKDQATFLFGNGKPLSAPDVYKHGQDTTRRRAFASSFSCNSVRPR